MTFAYLLVAHGSSDPRSQIGLDRLVHLVRQKLADRLAARPLAAASVSTRLIERSPSVVSAVLESPTQSLAQQILRVAQEAIIHGDRHLTILPLFLASGVHVQDDIPAEVARACSQLPPSFEISVNSPLGSHPGIVSLLSERFACLLDAHRILIAHGTRRREGQQFLETLARFLGAEVAYWSMLPSLGDRLQHAIARGQNSFAIQPYFLLTGGITDAIARQIEQLRQDFPHCQFHLGEPLGATAPLADLIVEILDP